MLVDEKPVAAFYVDVNSASDSGQVATTLDALVLGYGFDAQVGQYVWAVDADDNACLALVTERSERWVQLHMDESTWDSLPKRGDGAPGERVSLAPADPEDALRALLRTPPVRD